MAVFRSSLMRLHCVPCRPTAVKMKASKAKAVATLAVGSPKGKVKKGTKKEKEPLGKFTNTMAPWQHLGLGLKNTR